MGEQFLRHLLIIFLSIPPSIIISVPIGFFISNRPRAARVVLYIASILMTIPSLALFGLMVVLLAPVKLGIGITPAILAIMIYSLLPIIRNTYTALNQVNPRMIEAAKGIGMTQIQILLKIKLPLSIPVIMAGVRNAIVLGISVATFASLVGAGGLGYFIFSGISRTNFYMILTGTILVSFLGIGMNYLLMKTEDWLTPRGLKITSITEGRKK
ncbi:MAG: ABC transporter permease [Spirochaetales bacterium]|nr:ABC transporter permease [Spirochaetales bacterium]